MDIDIDVSNNEVARSVLANVIRASIIENNDIKPHTVGIYLQNIPIDRLTGVAAIPYNLAENYGYSKVDILHLKFLENFKSKSEIKKLLRVEPDWNLLIDDSAITRLFHLSKHGDVLKAIKPKNVEELADTLAIIRPNKKCLLSKYIQNKRATRTELYTKSHASDLRKSHAVAYALIIVLQLHLIKAGILNV